MTKINWIDEHNSNYPSKVEIKLSFIQEFKKKIYKKYKLKEEGNETERSERWCYYQKTFGYLQDGFSGKVYKVDLDTGKINLDNTD
jgi:hypothetical protein